MAELVRVKIGPGGRYMKMRKPAEDKMQTPTENKAADDFTEIDGIGPATAGELRNRGCRTFEDLRAADPNDLPSRAQAPVREWIDG